MFIRSTRNPRGDIYYHLVESYRLGSQVKQRILMSLGKAADKEVNLKKLLEVLSKELEIIPASKLLKEIDVKDTFILGPLLIIDTIFKQLNLYRLLTDLKQKHRKVQFDFVKIIFTLVISRFVEPCSKLKVFSHWQKLFYPDFLEGELHLQDIYRSLDILSKHKEDIEKTLYMRGKSQLSFFNECDVILYDLTTLRFESTREDLDNLRRFGYSKEKRSDCTQVVFGLLVDTEGMPLGFDVYPGNTFEGKTIPSVMTKLKKKFKIRRFILVGDRGLFSNENLQSLKAKGDEFIVGLKLGLLKDRHAEIYNLKNFKFINEDLAIYETSYNNDRCIITWSRKRAERDKKVREDILSKIEAQLSKKSISTRSFLSNSNYKKYIVHPKSKGKPTLNKSAIEQSERTDGFFGIITNTDLSSEEIIMNYKQLWKVENSFRELKGTLKTRPMFHWTDKRILGHLVVCFLSYLCEAYFAKKLHQRNITLKDKAITDKRIKSRPLSVAEAMSKLKEVRAIPVRYKNKTIWIRTDIYGNNADVFKAIGVKIPSKQLKIEST